MSVGRAMRFQLSLGAVYLGESRCRFRVWAPRSERVEVHMLSPEEAVLPLESEENGYHSATLHPIEPGSRYLFRLDGRELPDPASHHQPDGVHGPSRVIDHHFHWEDEAWAGRPLAEYIFYEIHVGAFTPEGTFDAIIPRLEELKELGVNSLEIMPVGQFPGDRNWGYDGVYPFAVQSSYGGPEGFKRLVNACHKTGISVTLDVVYNHLGPEGNYLRSYGPYFTHKYNTPWGEALNFDGELSDDVREYFLQNALYWLQSYHVDALRLDAVHAIYDLSAYPFLMELADRVEAFWRQDGVRRYLIAESDLNDTRLIRPRDAWGYGLDAQWLDDFHHSLHTLLTGERQGYYVDFGRLEDLVTAMKEGFVYSGKFSDFRKRRHGSSSVDVPKEQFVVSSQTHDQVGNRMLGERLSTLISFEAQKLAAAVALLSPYIPLLFMGQEYGEEAPFLYFISHTDPELIEAVKRGRMEEFKSFEWLQPPPDPVSVDALLESKLRWGQRYRGKHKALLEFHKALLGLRLSTPALVVTERSHMELEGIEDKQVMVMHRWWGKSDVFCLFNFGSSEATLKSLDGLSSGPRRKVLDSSDALWAGPGALLPDELPAGGTITVRGSSVAVYIGEEGP